ncbi:rhodanese-related sulfurtransferase [Terrimicrobium sacchariphilum]|jgi:rhodanese-related sulfurtransferase|uniref:Rhodanese-related sulfurtransferase n=1 Tax=Terrimicrobium sacchariphilum TaxID=690879 RepID=A0A146G9J7_TERSA|nr:rhodanese-like domain-containing protein [Terrimicrobium sacchariphilum]GAT33953.1 rhodanese-related sulfurtransferase [Terrimicrobium sacchariphilum]
MKHLAAILSILALLAGPLLASDISLQDLKKAIDSKTVTLIDVNGTESYNSRHIPGAVDFFAYQKDLADKLPADKNTLIVAYCYSPQCPAYKLAVDATEKLGYTNVKHFAPGISGWVNAGEPTQKGN